MIRKPMLAATLDNLSDVRYPVLCTPKIDGIRCLIVGGKAVTRSFKPFPNNYIRQTLEATCPEGFDGEIVVKGKQFNEITHLVMSEDGEPDFTYMVFDWMADLPATSYGIRMARLRVLSSQLWIERLLPVEISNEKELLWYEKKCLSEGYEGIMLRSPDGPYKFGRSTIKEGYLLKFKRFTDSEAIILATYEKMSNQNEAKKDALGHTERSTCAEGMVPTGTLGGFIVKDMQSGVEFGLGSGLSDEIRQEVWNNREAYVGKIVKYRSQKHGEKDAPRFPTFEGFRDERDM